jgi:hypothetical protein
MQVVKGNQNGYLVPGDIAGPPYPGGYKYGGLDLQVGGWATGRQPVTVNKLTVSKLNCGLITVRLTGIDLDNGKGYEMRNEYSKLECGIVYKQIVINAKLQT